MAPSVTGAASLRATNAALINSLPVSWENTFPRGERDFVGKYFHFFHSLQGTGEQVAFTHLFTPRGTSLLAPILNTYPFQAPSQPLYAPCSKGMP